MRQDVSTSTTLQLLEGALIGPLLRAPAHELRSVPEPPAREMVVADFAHQLWFERLPFAGTFGPPAAGAAGRSAGESGRTDKRFDCLLQILALFGVEAGGEAHVIELALIVIESQ